MSKKRRRKKPVPRRAEPADDRAVEALTVVWSQSVILVLICDVSAAATRLYAVANAEAKLIGMLSGLLFFAAAILGGLSLMLLPAVLRMRRRPPPRGFLIFSIVVSAAPLIAMLIQISN